MYTVTLQEYENSEAETRYNVPTIIAHRFGKAGFYKVQLINEFGIIDYEY